MTTVPVAPFPLSRPFYALRRWVRGRSAQKRLTKGLLDRSSATVEQALTDGARWLGGLGEAEGHLLVAAQEGNIRMALALLQHGANPNARDPSSGRTVLLLAVHSNRPELVEILAQRGADLYAVDREGASAWDVAQVLPGAMTSGRQGPKAKVVDHVGTMTALLNRLHPVAVAQERDALRAGVPDDRSPDPLDSSSSPLRPTLAPAPRRSGRPRL